MPSSQVGAILRSHLNSRSRSQSHSSRSSKRRHAPSHIYSTVVRLVIRRLQYSYETPYSVSVQIDSYGTGFFIDGQGHILTCAHVIYDATEVEIEIPNEGRKRYKSTLLGICPEFDLGMLRIEGYTNTQWCTLDKNDSMRVTTGDTVAVVGYPLGAGNLKQTKGVISGQQQNRYQTDAPINGGNSGGPMFKNGVVIGVNDSKNIGDNVENIGFSIPVARYFLVSALLHEPKRIVHFPTTIGFQYQNTYPEWMEYTGCRCTDTAVARRPTRKRHITSTHTTRRRRTGGTDTTSKATSKATSEAISKPHPQPSQSPLSCGVHVTRVYRDGLMSTTGLRRGDVVCKIDTMVVDAFGELSKKWMNQRMTLSNLLSTLPLGRMVPLEYWSSTKHKLIHTRFRIKERPLAIRHTFPTFETIDHDVIGGMVVMPLTLNHATMYRHNNNNYTTPRLRKYLKGEQCHQPKVVLSCVLTGSFLASLQILDDEPYVLKEINQRPVNSMATFRDAMRHPIIKKGRSFVEVRTEDDVMVVLPVDVLAEEADGLRKVHRY